jgi:hypothetical protein
MKHFDPTVYVAAGIVVFGAVVHATNQFKLARKDDRPFNWIDAFILIPTSVFSGGMFGFFSTLMSSNIMHLYIACGVGSFLGMAGLNALAERVLPILLSKKP